MREFYVFGFKCRGKLGTKVLEPMMMYAGGLKASLGNIWHLFNLFPAGYSLFPWTAEKLYIIHDIRHLR